MWLNDADSENDEVNGHKIMEYDKTQEKSIGEYTLAEIKEMCTGGYCINCKFGLPNGAGDAECAVMEALETHTYPSLWDFTTRLYKFTAQEVEDAENLLRLTFIVDIKRASTGELIGYSADHLQQTPLNPYLFPSVHVGSLIALSKIAGN